MSGFPAGKGLAIAVVAVDLKLNPGRPIAGFKIAKRPRKVAFRGRGRWIELA